jgi:hypothetical protein
MICSARHINVIIVDMNFVENNKEVLLGIGAAAGEICVDVYEKILEISPTDWRVESVAILSGEEAEYTTGCLAYGRIPFITLPADLSYYSELMGGGRPCGSFLTQHLASAFALAHEFGHHAIYTTKDEILDWQGPTIEHYDHPEEVKCDQFANFILLQAGMIDASDVVLAGSRALNLATGEYEL